MSYLVINCTENPKKPWFCVHLGNEKLDFSCSGSQSKAEGIAKLLERIEEAKDIAELEDITEEINQLNEAKWEKFAELKRFFTEKIAEKELSFQSDDENNGGNSLKQQII